MILRAFWHRRSISLVGLAVAVLLLPQTINADASKYPQFAQQTLPANITPTFIGVEQLVADLKSGVKPVIIDVRTAEEYREAHILGAVSAPLEEFKDYLKSIPRDRPVVLY
jgi:hypothetical protein